ncbi:hypothetical protein [Pseudophaeobacter flagellatus]|uniref:hypothetical protein n=1 Tax=Pseudophaeobacter flagellatus TaxID=2899119 RepID=UPI001E2E91DD|nr:hypothetical protein [Pseudophaeobacter flagellatus]MCD9146616.1 hypothetical protein [Pseudophaeobacter flagellatus]
MRQILCTLTFCFAPLAALAEAFERPIPQPQTDVAEFWFLMASILLIAALVSVHIVLKRR